MPVISEAASARSNGFTCSRAGRRGRAGAGSLLETSFLIHALTLLEFEDRPQYRRVGRPTRGHVQFGGRSGAGRAADATRQKGSIAVCAIAELTATDQAAQNIAPWSPRLRAAPEAPPRPRQSATRAAVATAGGSRLGASARCADTLTRRCANSPAALYIDRCADSSAREKLLRTSRMPDCRAAASAAPRSARALRGHAASTIRLSSSSELREAGRRAS